MNPDFERGRLYERSETYNLIEALLLLAASDAAQAVAMLQLWGNELGETLPKQQVMVEEITVIL